MSNFRLVLLMFTLSCLPLYVTGQAKSSRTLPPSVSPQREIAELRGQVAALQKKVEELESSINLAYIFLKDKQDRRDSIMLDLTETTYQRLDTDNGFFLISAEQAIPYLNGYKITLKVGNPLSMSYSGFKAKVKWVKAYDYKQYTQSSYEEWQKSVQEKEASLSDVLERGTWNKVELILTPATSEHLGYVNLSISTDTVRLYQK